MINMRTKTIKTRQEGRTNTNVMTLGNLVKAHTEYNVEEQDGVITMRPMQP
jgi:hypothetical protein